MKRKVEQRETQRAYATAHSYTGSVECDKVRRTGHTPILFGSAESDVALLPAPSPRCSLSLKSAQSASPGPEADPAPASS
jgi:hypothetical protein